MKRTMLAFCTLSFGLTTVAHCSGNDTTVDASDTGPADVAIEYYQAETAPPIPMIVDVVAGAAHTCMLISYGGTFVTYCFGKDEEVGGTKGGGLAVASNGVNPQPSFLHIASSHGAAHTCGIDTQKQIWCWGDDTKGQCGQGNVGTVVAAPQLALDSQFGIAKAEADGLALGTSSTCTFRILDNKLSCWGDNTSCQNDLYDTGGCSASTTSSTVATDDGTVFTAGKMLTLGATHTCFVATPMPSGTAALFCVGDNASKESGSSATTPLTPANKITPPATIISMALGDAYTCFVTDAPHALYCFGKNDQHQSNATSTNPVDPAAMTAITLPQSKIPLTVATSGAETCVIDTDGLLWCFGKSHGTNIDQIMGVKDVGKITMGAGHTCVVGHLPTDAVSAPGSILCWGDNTDGQAGGTAGGTIATPTAVTIPAAAP